MNSANLDGVRSIYEATAQGDFSAAEWADPDIELELVDGPESDWIAPLHVHHEDDEAWHVLEGALRFRLGEETFEVGPGDGVLAPKGTPHAYGNARRGQAARYLLVMTPRIRALIEALRQPGAKDHKRIFRAHDSELLG